MTDANSPRLRGIAYGCTAVLAWAVYNIGVAEGRDAGFSVADLTLLRYLGAAIALLPVAVRRLNRGVQMPSVGRTLLLMLLAGPHFGVLYNFGMPLTRLSHAVVISPGFSMIVAIALTAIAAGRIPDHGRLVGLALLIFALLLVAMERQSTETGPAHLWQGDLIFVLTGTLYGTFTFALGHWKCDAVVVTFMIAALSLLLVVPWYLAFATPTQHTSLMWAAQFVIQGVLGGGWAIVLYALSIRDLGAGRAAIFPALVPVAATLLAYPLTSRPPSALELAGTMVAALGMFLALKEWKRAAGAAHSR